MSEFDPLSAELRDFESSLARLTLAPSRIDRDRLMFRLGEDSVRRANRPWRVLWPAASAALLLLSCSLGWQLARVEESPVLYVDRPVGRAAPIVLQATADLTPNSLPDRSIDVNTAQVGSLVMHNAWMDARGVLGVRGLQTMSVESEGVLTPRLPLEERSMSDQPALRVGDRNAWQKWFEGRSGSDSPSIFLQKDSA